MANHAIFAPTFHGDLDAVRAILDADPSVLALRDAKGLTPLHVAASRGQDEVVRLLLDCGADIEGPTEPGEWTPLVFAAYRGHLGAAQMLVESGAGVGEADGNPIHFAGQRGHEEICRLLVDHGAVDDLVDPADADRLALFRAAYSYDPGRVERILESRPELVRAKDRHGRTPLHEACTLGDKETVEVLLRHGADTGARDDQNQTPLGRAIAHRQHAVTRLLEKHELARARARARASES